MGDGTSSVGDGINMGRSVLPSGEREVGSPVSPVSKERSPEGDPSRSVGSGLAGAAKMEDVAAFLQL